MPWFFVFFFVSGFCSVLYEIVWLRLCMAQFGVTSALVSIVLSTFMAGLGLGSWASGRLIRRCYRRVKVPLRLYALTELFIGISALVVPVALLWGRQLLESVQLSSSGGYYVASGVWIALTLVPWCACMGATLPVGMLAIRKQFEGEAHRSFSFLYLANVLGAVAGATVPLLLIELYGFHGTLKIGGALNAALALSAFALSLKPTAETRAPEFSSSSAKTSLFSRKPLVLLFLTGLTSMGMEVVWVRQFTPYLSTVVYAFASILARYLISTYIGSQMYRRWSRSHEQEGRPIWILLGTFALLPLVTADPHMHFSKGLRVVGIVPFSGILGFVTPMLVDRWSGGDPDKAGSAYAINVLGCILGPLLAGFLLLPLMSERWVLLLLASPWLAIGLYQKWSSGAEPAPGSPAWQQILAYGGALAAVLMVFSSNEYAAKYKSSVVLRDSTATIIATGEGMSKRLLINGIGITYLTPTTKMMAHLPLASLDHNPQNALVICFGMGTTFRSLLSWGIPTTAVELVPSVPHVFWYYHSDAPELLRSPLAHVVIDDGRRYLERTSEQYDVITIDPPPPVEAAGSSLLYSTEFYSTLKRRLRPGGILQQWLPSGDAADHATVARALQESFPYVRGFRSGERRNLLGRGYHFLASEQPIRRRAPADLVKRTPVPALADLMEWGPEPDPEHEFGAVLESEFSLDQMIAEAPQIPALHDDLPLNEYYILRRTFKRFR